MHPSLEACSCTWSASLPVTALGGALEDRPGGEYKEPKWGNTVQWVNVGRWIDKENEMSNAWVKQVANLSDTAVEICQTAWICRYQEPLLTNLCRNHDLWAWQQIIHQQSCCCLGPSVWQSSCEVPTLAICCQDMFRYVKTSEAVDFYGTSPMDSWWSWRRGCCPVPRIFSLCPATCWRSRISCATSCEIRPKSAWRSTSTRSGTCGAAAKCPELSKFLTGGHWKATLPHSHVTVRSSATT